MHCSQFHNFHTLTQKLHVCIQDFMLYSQLLLIFSALIKTLLQKSCWHSPIFVFGKCVTAFLFELVLCEPTLISPCQLEEIASQPGLLVKPLVLMLCHSAVLR